MCILCAVQGGSHRAIGMLQWLVIPVVVVWSVSQLLPPGFRLEITSPRLACVAVLLGTIFWYEIFLPQVSAYRARRLARVREQQLSMAVEVQKLRKTATRRCRNCLAIYRDQSPGGGKFMCSSCGHLSKRPILDLPGHSGIRTSGFFGDFDWKKSWFCNLWCTQNIGNWDAPVNTSSCLRDEEAFSQESKGEKARRKAEEKRLARLEKEMIEEEERLQREEVARLIEERRKLREEKTESDKEDMKDGRREESDRKRRSRKREKDKSPAKSTSAAGDHDNPRQESSCSSLRTRVEIENIVIKREKLPSLSSPTLFSLRKKSPASTLPANRSHRPASGSSNSTVKASNSDPQKSKLSLSLPVRPVTVDPPTMRAPKKSWHQFFAEKDEVFQDQYFVKDLSSGSRVKDDLISDSFHSMGKVCNPGDVKKPAPIESPSSKSGSLLEVGSENVSEQGTWQMWSSSLCKDGLDLVGGPTSWLSALEQNRITRETTMTPAEMEKNILERSCKHRESFDARELKDDGMVNQFITEHHPWDGMIASQMHSFQDDEKCHLSHLGFDVGAAGKVERCLRPNMYAPRMPLNRSQAYYYYWGWPIPWKRNAGIPMVFVPPRRRSFFVPSQMYGQPVFSLRGSQEQGGSIRW